MEPIRVGLIGAGWIGSHHAHNVNQNPNARLVAVCDLDEDKARALVEREGIEAEVMADYQKMLAREDIQAVIVASPNAMHAEHAAAACQAGKHIYLEKPMAITPEDCRKIVDAVEKAGVRLCMGYHRRLNPLVQYAKQLQQEGKLGEIVLAESDYIHHIPGDWPIWDWLGRESVAGSLIHAGAGHNIDLLRYLCGEVAQVSCFKDVRIPRPHTVETEDVAIINLLFENGTLGRAVMFVGPILPFRFTLRLYGTKGTLDNNCLWLDTMPNFDQPGSAIRLPDSWIPDNVQGGISEPWKKCLDSFIEDIQYGRRPSNDHISGFNTAAVCFAAVRSALENGPVAPERL